MIADAYINQTIVSVTQLRIRQIFAIAVFAFTKNWFLLQNMQTDC